MLSLYATFNENRIRDSVSKRIWYGSHTYKKINSFINKFQWNVCSIVLENIFEIELFSCFNSWIDWYYSLFLFFNNIFSVSMIYSHINNDNSAKKYSLSTYILTHLTGYDSKKAVDIAENPPTIFFIFSQSRQTSCTLNKYVIIY